MFTMSNSEIQQFYKDQTVFVTGGTGLLGRLTIRKLLTACHEVKKIYVLIREKRDKTPEERFEKLLENFCFASIKSENGNIKDKLAIIAGDCLLPNLGMSEQDQNRLKNEVTCIIHISATIKFDEKIKIAGYNNVRAVKDLLRMAKNIQQLKSFVYVSTAYSNCNQEYEIKEQFYDPPMTAENFFTMLKILDDDTLDAITPHILGKWPNTYTFTKAIAESIVKEEGRHFPTAIARPSIVLASVKEPEPGWIDVLQGVSVLTLGVYVGLIRCLRLELKVKSLIVPCDYVVNNILAVGWNVHHERSTINEDSTNKVPIYNFTVPESNSINWGCYQKYGLEAFYKYPSMLGLWWPFLFVVENELLGKIGKAPKAGKIYEKIHDGIHLMSYFTSNSWHFENSNMEKLWNKMNEKDKELFQFSMENLDWQQYLEDCLLGARVHTLKDPLDTLPKAERKQLFLKIVHYVFVALLLYLVYKFTCLLFNFFQIFI